MGLRAWPIWASSRRLALVSHGRAAREGHVGSRLAVGVSQRPRPASTGPPVSRRFRDVIRRAAEEGPAPASATVMMVGHNPGMQELTDGACCRRAPSPSGLIAKAHRNFPTAAAADVPVRLQRAAPVRRPVLSRTADDVRIYKILPRAEWLAAAGRSRALRGLGGGPSGRLHPLSPPPRRLAKRRGAISPNLTDLVVLEVEGDDLGVDLKWEPSRGGDLFPHLCMVRWPSAPCRAVHEAPLGADAAFRGCPRHDRRPARTGHPARCAGWTRSTPTAPGHQAGLKMGLGPRAPADPPRCWPPRSPD